jgi:hypothetical protein
MFNPVVRTYLRLNTAPFFFDICWLESKDGQPAPRGEELVLSSRACCPDVIHSAPCAAILATVLLSVQGHDYTEIHTAS